MGGAHAIEGMVPGGTILRLVLLIDGEPVGELRSVVGQDCVNAQREGGEEALEEGGGVRRAPPWVDLQENEAGGPVDGDEGVGRLFVQACKMLDVDMDEAGGALGLEGCARRVFAGGSGRDAVAAPAPVKRGPGQVRLDAAPHHLERIVEREGELRAQLDAQRLFNRAQRGFQCVRRV